MIVEQMLGVPASASVSISVSTTTTFICSRGITSTITPTTTKSPLSSSSTPLLLGSLTSFLHSTTTTTTIATTATQLKQQQRYQQFQNHYRNNCNKARHINTSVSKLLSTIGDNNKKTYTTIHKINTLQQSVQSSSSTTTTMKSTITSNDEDNFIQQKYTMIRILGLHGSGGNGQQFENQVLMKWKDYFTTKTKFLNTINSSTGSSTTSKTKQQPFLVDFTIAPTITAPVKSNNNNTDTGYQWWSMPPFVRSSNATTYEPYFTCSQKLVLDALVLDNFHQDDDDDDEQQQSQQQQNQYRPNLIVAHSQGAILLTSLLALDAIPLYKRPTIGYILNGVAWPNPYTKQLESLSSTIPTSTSTSTLSTPTSTPTTATGTSTNKQRVLIIIGNRDTINTPDQALRVAYALEPLYDVTILRHPGGHSVPVPKQQHHANNTDDSTILDAVYEWIIAPFVSQ